MNLRCFLMAFLTVLSASSVSAHELPGNTATVTLRDGLLTVEAHLDIEAIVLAQRAGDLAKKVALTEKQVGLLVASADGERLPMQLKQFPTVAQIHELLQRRAKNGHHHPKLVLLKWHASRAAPGASEVRVRFATELGPVLVSFVEPRSQLVAPGVDARFKSASSQTLTNRNKLRLGGTDTRRTRTR